VSRSANGVEAEISCGFCVMHGKLEVVFISAVLLLCKRLSAPVVEASGQSRISCKSIIMEYTPWEIYALQLGNTKLEVEALVWKAAVVIFEDPFPARSGR
jgi:hypothetical protein